MVSIRATQADSGADTFAEVNWPVDTAVGDRVFALVFGGNQVTGFYPDSGDDTWTVLAHVTGQEAQGEVLTKLITQDNLDTGFYQLYFDGSDPFRIVTIVAEGNAGYRLTTSARDGAVATTFPAYDQAEGTRTLADELLVYFVGSRNATDMPTSARGTLVEFYDDPHTMGCWVYETTGAGTVANTLGIPERSGHYRAVLRLFDWATGPWNTDAELVYLPSDGGISYDTYDVDGHLKNLTYKSGQNNIDDPNDTRDLMLTHSWDGVYRDHEDDSSPQTYPGGNGLWTIFGQGANISFTQMMWYQTWATCQRKITEPATSSTFTDPVPDTALDVEWEPTTDPEGYQLEISAIGGDGGAHGFVGAWGPLSTVGQAVGYRYVDNASVDSHGGYNPGWKTRTGIISGHQLNLPVLDAGGHTAYQTAVLDVPAGSFDTYVAATVIDAVTMAGDNSQALDSWVSANPGLQYAVAVDLIAKLRPRYRFLFDPLGGTENPRRLWPRSDDLGLGGGGRVYPPPNTQQHGTRTGSSSPL